MKQVIRKGLKDIIVDEVPDPVVTPHHVLIRPCYSLISSGTETASIHSESILKEVAEKPGHLKTIWNAVKVAGPVATAREVRAKFSEYAVLGYSGAGVVVEKHPTVTDLDIGDRVAYGGEGTGHAETILAGRQLVARLPEELPFEQACFATLGSIALHAVRTAALGLGEVVAVVGLGLVGQLVAQLAKLQGGVVIGIDIKGERASLAAALGADHVLSGEGIREAALAATGGRGADCVIVAAAARSSAPARLALEICRDRGRMVIVGAVGLDFPWNEMYLKEIQLLMSRAYGPGSYDPDYEQKGKDYPFAYVRWTENRNMQEFLRLVAGGRVQVKPLVTHEYPLEEAPAAYATILEPGSRSLAVLLRYPAAASAAPAAGFQPRRRVEALPGPRQEAGELGVALLGAGNLARWAHLPNITGTRGVRLRAIHSSSGARGKSYALRFGAAYCTSEYQQILDDPQVQVVFVATRNQHHAPQSLAALAAGKHVFVEKPMALTEEECRGLHRAVAQSGRQLTVGFNRRFAPDYVGQKKRLQGRRSPVVINCRINSPGISGEYWMADPAIGGAILGEACHFVDLFYWLLDSEPVSVFAYSLPQDRPAPVGQNNMAATFRFADGSVATLAYCTVGSRTSGGERLEVFAEGLAAVAQDFKSLATLTGLARRRSRLFADKGYAEQWQDFVRSLREGSPPAVTVVDGARATLGCLRMLASARALAPFAIDLPTVLA